MKQNISLYRNELDSSIKAFKNVKDKHPEIAVFENLVDNLNIEHYARLMAEDIKAKLCDYWINPDFRKSEISQKLDGLLIEYSYLDEIDSKSYVYGLVDVNHNVSDFDRSYNLENYDLCTNFQSLPGPELSVTNDLHRLNHSVLDEKYDYIEIYFENGWSELTKIYKDAVKLTLSLAFESLIEAGLIDKLNMNPNFFILIQQHDCEGYLIAKR
ncbi:MAG: hypothetical protein N4A72_12960 [Bacteroidales bacterium]|nr:hypothetical protein [Bacteroidales bacterium]